MAASSRVAPPPPAGRAAWFRPATPLERGRVTILLVLVVLTAGAWTATIYQTKTMEMPMGVVAPDDADDGGMSEMAMTGMAGMADAGWSWDTGATFLLAWAVMMAAMMFPAAAPMILLFHRVHAGRQAEGGSFVPTWVFAAGYLLVWTTIGAVTYVVVRLGSDLAGRLGAGDRETWGPLALGATLAVAGLYQVTPLKRVCLDHCRTPMDFVMTHWRAGQRGALRMGLVHGAYCLGCCWALFAVLVAAGVMSLAWMLLLTLVVFAEKELPVGPRAARVVGVGFLALGAAIVVGVVGMPWSA
ncbi:MAG: DUF2182 domain-containing protein [Thermomicrobiales bacterium]